MIKKFIYFTVVVSISACTNLFDSSGEQVSNEKDMMVYGKKIYQSQCMICHGEKGNARIAQSADLTLSKLSETEIGDLVYHGKKTMPPFADKLGEPEITAVAKYVAALRSAQ